MQKQRTGKSRLIKRQADGQIYGWVEEWTVVTMATELSEALGYLSFLSIFLTHILDGQVTGLSRLPHGGVMYLYEHGSTDLCAHQVSESRGKCCCKMKFIRARQTDKTVSNIVMPFRSDHS